MASECLAWVYAKISTLKGKEMGKNVIRLEKLYTTTYDDSNKTIWDEFVSNNSHSWTGHHSSILAFEKERKKAENFSILLFDYNGTLLAILPLLLITSRDLKFLKKRILTSGTQLASGPLLSEKIGKKQRKKVINFLFSRVTEIGKHLKCDAVSIGYPNIIAGQLSINYYGYFPLKHFGYKENNVITMIKDLKESEENLFASLEHRCRKSINKCRKENILFQEIKEKDQWLNCHDLNIQTLGKDGYSKTELEILWDQFVMKGLSKITAIFYEGQIINVVLTTGWRDFFYFWIGFNAKNNEISGGANLLLWETMLFYRRQGFRFCEIGSMEFGSGKQGNISKFKESFNGTPMYMLSGTLELRPFKGRLVDLLNSMRH